MIKLTIFTTMEEEFEEDFEEIEDDFEDLQEDDVNNIILTPEISKIQSPGKKLLNFLILKELPKIIQIERQLTKEEKEEIERRKLKFERAKELQSIIALGHVEIELLDLPPKSEFELYKTKLGKFSQVSTQIPAENQR